MMFKILFLHWTDISKLTLAIDSIGTRCRRQGFCFLDNKIYEK